MPRGRLRYEVQVLDGAGMIAETVKHGSVKLALVAWRTSIEKHRDRMIGVYDHGRDDMIALYDAGDVVFTRVDAKGRVMR